MTSTSSLKKFSPFLLLLVVIAACQYYVLITHEAFTTYLRDKLSDGRNRCCGNEVTTDYEYTRSDVVAAFSIPFKLPAVPQGNGSGPLFVLLLSYARSGSSFVGDLLQSYPYAFYHFEPLHFLSGPVVNSVHTEARQLLNKLFLCQVSQLPGFLSWQKSHKNFMKLKRSVRLWKACSPLNTCYNATYIDSYCANHSVVIVKTIRLDLKEAARMFVEFPELNLKIIYLARDPRGTMNSRMQNPVKGWCKKDPLCFNPKQFCNSLENDAEVACDLLSTRPQDFMIVRYEDLAKQSIVVARRMANFLGFTRTNEMEDFLTSHTSSTASPHKAVEGVEFPYSTFRNSVITSTKWRQEMPFVKVARIQKDCGRVLEWLGYHKYTTSGAMKSNVNFDKDIYKSLSAYCPQEINMLS